jgi:RNase P subunit RPR2
MDEQAMRQMSLEILTDIKKWRRAHPRATYGEIEDEIHKRLMQLEARLIEGAVEESLSREWARGSEQEAVLCPTCATPLQARGKHKRTFQGNGGENVTLSRTYGMCPKCGEGLFPLDEELGLLPGHLAPRKPRTPGALSLLHAL